MLRCGRVESERPSAMMASNYLYFFMEVFLLDKHPCLAQSYMLDEQGHVSYVGQHILLSAPNGHILFRAEHLNNSQDGHRNIFAKRQDCQNTVLPRAGQVCRMGVFFCFFWSCSKYNFLSDKAFIRVH